MEGSLRTWLGRAAAQALSSGFPTDSDALELLTWNTERKTPSCVRRSLALGSDRRTGTLQDMTQRTPQRLKGKEAALQ